jgi:osmoprotectant transport system permease protein
VDSSLPGVALVNLFDETVLWFSRPRAWTGTGGIWERLGEHIAVTMIVVLVASLIALPIGIAIGHGRHRGSFVVFVAGAARAVPTLGLLTLLALMVGVGVGAPIVALIVLAVPPLLAGAYSGVASVDAATVDASRAMGMTEWQIVRTVELPIAAPVILGGLRSAVLQVIATATLAAYTSDTGLGRYVFAGLKSRDYGEMIGGSIIVVALALAVDALLSRIVRTRPQIPATTTGSKL